MRSLAVRAADVQGAADGFTPGASAVATAKVLNPGRRTAPASTVRFTVEEAASAAAGRTRDYSVPALPAGASAEVSHSFRLWRAGQWTVRAAVRGSAGEAVAHLTCGAPGTGAAGGPQEPLARSVARSVARPVAVAGPTAVLRGRNVELSRLPASLEEFQGLVPGLSRTPEGAAGLFVAAALLLERDPALGRACASLVLRPEDLLGPGGFTPSTRFLLDRFAADGRIARSYVRGTVPVGYALPSPPLVVATSRNTYSQMAPDRIKVFVASSGADSARPILLARDAAGVWRVAEFSSLAVGVRSR